MQIRDSKGNYTQETLDAMRDIKKSLRIIMDKYVESGFRLEDVFYLIASEADMCLMETYRHNRMNDNGEGSS